jgi:23S rRNA pseudouridine1911/1915/1917 synthase
VHFAQLGHPILGDKLYGAGEALFMRACEEGVTPELLAAFDGLPRHALHAHRLTFPHPVTGERITVESPLPDDLQEVTDDLTARESIPPRPARATG